MQDGAFGVLQSPGNSSSSSPVCDKPPTPTHTAEEEQARCCGKWYTSLLAVLGALAGYYLFILPLSYSWHTYASACQGSVQSLFSPIKRTFKPVMCVPCSFFLGLMGAKGRGKEGLGHWA
jgi:hypothetical protein